MSRPVIEATATQQFDHPRSRSRLGVGWRSGQMIHSVTREGHEEIRAAVWAVGSGREGKSYVIQVGDALFQSPLSWYTARRTWDLSPGFENDSNPGFFRPLTSDCLFCHSGRARPRAGTLNRYLDPPFEPPAIGCSRCHGDTAAHLSQPERRNIVNPSRLEPSRRDAVCEQCHLSGEARIPNPDEEFSNFEPGMRMEDVFSVYVREASGDPKGLKVVSHSEQMVLSRCFLESKPQMWCMTCHDPHREPENKVAWYGEKCMGCHSGEASRQHQKERGEDCASCHMPSIRSYDGGHTAFHDHWIRRRRIEPQAASPLRLRAWRPPDEALQNRNLGLAYISVGSKGDARQIQQGMRLLGSAPADGAVETARGFVLLRSGNAREAVAAFRRASSERPEDSTRRLNLAAALLALGSRVEAKENAEKAIALEPLLEDAYALLAEIEPARAGYWKARHQKLAERRIVP